MRSYSKPKKLNDPRKSRSGKSKYYYVAWYDKQTGERGRLSTQCTTQDAANLFRQRLERREVDPQAARAIETSSMTFDDALSSWLSSKDGAVSRDHFAILDSRAKRFWSPFFGPRRLRDLISDDVEQYLKRRAGGTLPLPKGVPKTPARKTASTTVNKCRTHLREFFRHCIAKQWLDRSPADGVKSRTGSHARSNWHRLDRSEVDRLLQACRFRGKVPAQGKRNAGGVRGGKRTRSTSTWEQTVSAPEYLYPLVATALDSGFRRGTLLSLRWEHIDLDIGRWRIPGEFMKIPRDYSMPVMPSVLDALREYHDSLEADRRRPSSPIFGLPPATRITRAFQKAVRRAGLDGLKFHDLRRCFLNSCLDSGVPLTVAAEFTAHRDINVVLRHYQENREEDRIAAVRAFAQHRTRSG